MNAHQQQALERLTRPGAAPLFGFDEKVRFTFARHKLSVSRGGQHILYRLFGFVFCLWVAWGIWDSIVPNNAGMSVFDIIFNIIGYALFPIICILAVVSLRLALSASALVIDLQRHVFEIHVGRLWSNLLIPLPRRDVVGFEVFDVRRDALEASPDGNPREFFVYLAIKDRRKISIFRSNDGRMLQEFKSKIAEPANIDVMPASPELLASFASLSAGWGVDG